MNYIKNISYTLFSNILSTIISVIITLIVPKLLGVKEYSYFQLFAFYIGYGGFLNLGLTEGIILRYAGAYYEDLRKDRFNGQLKFMAFSQAVISLTMVVLASVLISDPGKRWVFYLLAVGSWFYNLRVFFLYILQCTERIKEYSLVVIYDKIAYISGVTVLMICGVTNFVPYVLFYCFGFVVSVAIGIYFCHDIIKTKGASLYAVLQETWKNMSVGIKLVIANSAGTLIIGFVRQGIESVWGIELFGRVSLSLSVSNMLVLLIDAIAIVLFPMLRRMDEKKIVPLYAEMRNTLMLLMLGMMLLYYPVKEILEIWLPNYAESLKYMALLFPICLFEGKMSLLINTYLKALRKENIIMWVNLFTVALSAVSTRIIVFYLNNLNLAVLSIVFLIAVRSIVVEVWLSRFINVHVVEDMCIEITLTAIFIWTSWSISGIAGMMIYTGSYVLLLINKRKTISYIVNIFQGKLNGRAI